MNVPLVLEHVKLTDVSGVIPPESPYYPPLWQGGAVYIDGANPRIAYSTGTLWIIIPGPGDYQPAGDYQPHDAELDYWAGIAPSANVKSIITAPDYADIRKQLGIWTSVLKATTEVKSTLTPQADAALLFPVAANKTYAWRGVINYTTNATVDFKYNFTGPAIGTGAVRYGSSAVGVGLTATIVGAASAYGTNISIVSTTTDFLMGVYGTLINGTNAGAVQFNWSQDTGGVVAIQVNAGSWIEFKEL